MDNSWSEPELGESGVAVVAAGQSEECAAAIVRRAEGAIVTAAPSGTPELAHQARRAAAPLLAGTAVT
ncbi:hypothetical protein ACFQ6U_18065 [Streptomyces sp. NPDC056465]|uniref:hypothetical protein n=1 Tax=unclassified Streptomyces TaxID=2593676 RepID=UPI0035DEBE8A